MGTHPIRISARLVQFNAVRSFQEIGKPQAKPPPLASAIPAARLASDSMFVAMAALWSVPAVPARMARIGLPTTPQWPVRRIGYCP